MAELFEVQKAAISKHLKNIFASGELMENSVVSVLETTAADGKNYPTRYYNLGAIIRLSGELQKGHYVPHLGKQDPEGVHHQGLCYGR